MLAVADDGARVIIRGYWQHSAMGGGRMARLPCMATRGRWEIIAAIANRRFYCVGRHRRFSGWLAVS